MPELNNILLKTQYVIGKPVISLNGDSMGAVVQVVINPEFSTVAGFTLSARGLFKGDRGVRFDFVKSIGDYAIIVENQNSVLPLNTIPELEKLSKVNSVYNMQVVTPEGKLLGSVDDFYFDTMTGKIEKYLLSGGTIKNIFHGRACIPSANIEHIGKDLLIATSDAEISMEKEDNGLQEGLNNIKVDLDNLKDDLDHWKDDLENNWEKTKSRVFDISKTVGINLKEAARTSKGKSKAVLNKTSEILNEKKSQLKTTYEWWIDRLQAAKNGSCSSLPDHDVKVIVGLKAGKSVVDNMGKIIVEENTIVTEEIITACQKAGKMRELLISVATRDLDDRINSLKEE